MPSSAVFETFEELPAFSMSRRRLDLRNLLTDDDLGGGRLLRKAFAGVHLEGVVLINGIRDKFFSSEDLKVRNNKHSCIINKQNLLFFSGFKTVENIE